MKTRTSRLLVARATAPLAGPGAMPGGCCGLIAFLSLLAGAPAVAQQTVGDAYTTPRTAFGQPDIQGIWQALNTAVWDIEDHAGQLGVPAGQGVVVGGGIPYQPWAAERRAENYENRLADDPEANCKMVGVPRITYMPYPFQIVQTPTQVTILYEYVHTVRNLYLDSDHPDNMPDRLWMGDSRGRWEGDTLVVDVVQFTDRTWFDRSGNFHGEALHVVERYTRTGPDHMIYEVTIEDPEVFTESWQMRMPLYRRQEEKHASAGIRVPCVSRSGSGMNSQTARPDGPPCSEVLSLAPVGSPLEVSPLDSFASRPV